MKTLIFFKTHFISNAVISEYKKIKNSISDDEELILFIDNDSNFLELDNSNPIRTINFNGTKAKCFISNMSIIEDLKLPIDIAYCNQNASNVLWYCSDYPFYVVKHFFPDYDFYWSLEYDVFCNGNSYRIFLDKYKTHSDLIISHYRNLINDPDWCWQVNTAWLYSQATTYGSFFPVVRLSKNAIDFLYNKRIEQGAYYKTFENKENVFWPFCEIFVPTELANNGYSIENISSENLRHAPLYNLNIERIFENPDFKLYHPVK